ncbi:MAG: DUF2332 domain-containing protein [Steroidobacteraceae bacterium]
MSSVAHPLRRAFAEQAGHCRRIGSEFTALLCDVFPACLETASAVIGRMLDWPGDPAPLADNVPLRVAGAMHAIARSREVPALTAVYPPNPPPTPAALTSALVEALLACPDVLGTYLDSPPQTNEVGRSAPLLAGWLEVARRTGLPLSLYEIGASAGLNLMADRYGYRFGPSRWGRDSATPVLSPDWAGPPPAIDTELSINSRHGCDRSPVDLASAVERERLITYVWPDQGERLARLEAAIATARANPPVIDRADAAAWVRERIGVTALAGTARLLFHSIVWQYLPAATQEGISEHIAAVTRAARSDAAFAWLRFEMNGDQSATELRLKLWPGGEDRLLAVSHAHGSWVRWVG